METAIGGWFFLTLHARYVAYVWLLFFYPTVPSRPRRFKAKWKGDIVVLKWQEPKKLNGPVQYKLCAKVNGSVNCSLICDDCREWPKLKKLEQYTKYIFLLTAYNSDKDSLYKSKPPESVTIITPSYSKYWLRTMLLLVLLWMNGCKKNSEVVIYLNARKRCFHRSFENGENSWNGNYLFANFFRPREFVDVINIELIAVNWIANFHWRRCFFPCILFFSISSNFSEKSHGYIYTFWDRCSMEWVK